MRVLVRAIGAVLLAPAILLMVGLEAFGFWLYDKAGRGSDCLLRVANRLVGREYRP